MTLLGSEPFPFHIALTGLELASLRDVIEFGCVDVRYRVTESPQLCTSPGVVPASHSTCGVFAAGTERDQRDCGV